MLNTDYDYIVIGSGIAGLNVALLAQDHGSVLIITKGKIDDCNTRFAQGGIAAAVGPGDSAELHYQDTLSAGVGLCDPKAVEILTTDGPERVNNLMRWGVAFDTDPGPDNPPENEPEHGPQVDAEDNSELGRVAMSRVALSRVALGREGAHSMARILHAGGDATGRYIELALTDRVAGSAKTITVLEYTLATDLLVEDGRATGVETLNSATGQVDTFTGRFIVIATGGAGQLFRYTTNPPVATGDGVALAFRAGAQVMDMEFYQFHPTAFRLPGSDPFLLSEAMRGEGAVLRNQAGQGFMSEYHPMADLAPRDVVSRAISAEMETAGTEQVYLDISHIPSELVRGRFPNIDLFCQSHGLDITQDPIPVAPAAHYMMGGIRTDTWGRTNIRGLYSCGESACAAVHGANRLASNSLLDTVVFAHRVVDETLGLAPPLTEDQAGEDQAGEDQAGGNEAGNVYQALRSREMVCGNMPELSVEALQDLMWRNVGISRNGSRLLLSARILNVWERTLAEAHDLASHQLRNMLLVARLMVEGALLRQESRGSHFRMDFPETSEYWRKHIILSR